MFLGYLPYKKGDKLYNLETHHLLYKKGDPPPRQSTRTLQKIAWLNDFVAIALFLPPTVTHTHQLVTPQPPGIQTLSPHSSFNSSYLHFLATVSTIHEPTSCYHAKNDLEWVATMEKELSTMVIHQLDVNNRTYMVLLTKNFTCNHLHDTLKPNPDKCVNYNTHYMD